MRISLLLVFCLFIAMPVSAATTDAGAQAVEVRGAASAHGDLFGFTINTLEAGEVTNLKISADAGYFLRWKATGIAGPTIMGGQVAAPTQQSFERLPETGMYEGLKVRGGLADADHLINVIPRAGGTFDFSVEEPEAAVTTLTSVLSRSGPCLGRYGIAQVGPCGDYDESTPAPTFVRMPDDAQIVTAPGRAHMRVDGETLVVDIRGVDLQYGSQTLRGRAVTPDAAGTYEAYFTRIVLVNASVSAVVDGNHDQVAWVSAESETSFADKVTLRDAYGTTQVRGHNVELEDGTVLQGPLAMRSTATDYALVLGFTEPSMGTHGIASEGPPAGLLWIPAFLGSLVVLAGIAFAVRQTRAHTTMRHVEAALGAHRFKRAARLADHLIRTNPKDESAHLGRAIAFTKAGEPAKAVAGLDPLLRRHRPADGTLHYALGVALFNMGRAREARAAMAEAVERTPALLGDMVPDLRPRYDGGAYS